MNDNKNRLYGILLTIVFHLGLLLLLIFGGFEAIVPQEEEGILVVVGDPDSFFEEGKVNTTPPEVEPADPEPEPEPVKPDPVKQPESTPKPEPKPEVTTQDSEEAAQIAQDKKKKEEEQKKKEEEAKKKAEEAKKAEAAKKAEEQKKKEEEERKKKEEELKKQQDAIKDKVANIFQNSNKAENAGSKPEGESGKGQTNGTSDVGSIDTKHPGYGSYDLGGRGIRGGLPMPSYSSNESGTVVVNITVNSEGKVTKAIISAKGTTTTSAALRQSAIDAAKKALFDPKDDVIAQNGNIVYRFDSDN